MVVAVTDGIPEPSCFGGCEDDTVHCTDGIDNDDDGSLSILDATAAVPAGSLFFRLDRWTVFLESKLNRDISFESMLVL